METANKILGSVKKSSTVTSAQILQTSSTSNIYDIDSIPGVNLTNCSNINITINVNKNKDK